MLCYCCRLAGHANDCSSHLSRQTYSLISYIFAFEIMAFKMLLNVSLLHLHTSLVCGEIQTLTGLSCQGTAAKL